MLRSAASTQEDGFTRYRIKLWLATEAEPSGWHLEMTSSGPARGSVALIAHYADVTFGNVTVTAPSS